MISIVWKKTARNPIYWIILILVVKLSQSKRIKIDKRFKLTKETNDFEFESNFVGESNTNEFIIEIDDINTLNTQILYIVMESDNLNFYLNIWKSGKRKSIQSKNVGSFTGNCLFVLGMGLFDNFFKEFKEKSVLRFALKNVDELTTTEMGKFKLKVVRAKRVSLVMGKIYTSIVDPSIGRLDVDWIYNQSMYKNLTKLRFQASVVRFRPNWRLTSILIHKNAKYMMNHIFKKTVGGILSLPQFQLCVDKECVYSMQLTLKGVDEFSLETFMIEQIEKISIHHFENYYDKTYNPGTFTIYELPFSEEMTGLDVSVSIIPVTGNTQLYINAKTIPTNEDSYDFKMNGQLAKKMTISWGELTSMKAQGTSLFIGVMCPIPGEYMLKVDAHELGYKGSLTAGITEAGMVQFNEITNYLYMLEVVSSQDVTLEIKLSVVTGNVDLLMLQCEDYDTCMIEGNDIKGKRKGIIKIRDGAQDKRILKTFRCNKSKDELVSLCQFVIGVLGKEKGASHFEISLNHNKDHLLMIPGHSMSVNVEPLQKAHYKFSFPKRMAKNNKLFLSVESLWGEFTLAVSKTIQFPTKRKSDFFEMFESPKNALYQSMRIIDLDPSKLSDHHLEGIYYLTIEALQETSINLKFYEKGNGEISIHTLTAGKQIRGEINNIYETLYYTLPVSLVPGQAASLEVNITPLKGHFVLMGNTNGTLPTVHKNQYFSENNRLKFQATDIRKEYSEYLVGVALHEFFDAREEPTKEYDNDQNDSFQFLISVSYTNRPIRLSPGIISTYTINRNNMYLIEVLDDFNDLLILKSIIDGYTMKLCGHFSTTDDSKIDAKKDSKEEYCKYTAVDKTVSLYLKQKDIQFECQRVKAASENHRAKCFFVFTITGEADQVFRVGFTFNERPFQLVKDQIINGPYISDASGRLNFIYHAEKDKEIGIYFNSKGRDMDIFSKLVRSDNFKDSFVINFPTKSNFDSENINKNGYVHSVFYSKERVSEFGKDPELLISIRPQEFSSNIDKDIYDGTSSFVLQTTAQTIEITRTQTITRPLLKEKTYFFTFYNNGNTESLKVYVLSNNSAHLRVMIAPGKKARPPLTCKPLVKKSGIGSIELSLTSKDMKESVHSAKASLKGYYVVSVAAEVDTEITLYWNNKPDLNYIELTPNEPSQMKLDTNKKFYFTFYARDIDGGADENSINLRRDIRVYIKTDIRANIYLVKSTTGELIVPGPTNNQWKSSLGDAGGVSLLDILSKDPNYCVDCLYIGNIEHQSPGEVSLVVNVQHSDVPVTLKTGITFPEYLKSNEKMLFRMVNPDDGFINLALSMTTGHLDLYISRDASVSRTKYDMKFSLESGLSIHNFIRIDPKEYKILGSNEWFVMIENLKLEEAGCAITMYKNSVKSPIEPGVTKFMHLAVKEKLEFFYKPKIHEDFFEIRVELVRVFDPSKVYELRSTFDEWISVYEMGLSGAHLPLNPSEVDLNENFVYFKFKIPKNNNKIFGIEILNNSSSAAELKLDLLNGDYKLVNLNDHTFGLVSGDQALVYEAYGSPGQYLFVEVKKCIGSPKVAFYGSEFTNVEYNQEIKLKTLEDNNSSVHYAKLDGKNAFFKITNEKGIYSSFVINVFGEKDMDNNPYYELANEGSGKVSVDTEHQVVKFQSVSINQFVNPDFFHEITYTVFLSLQVEVMRYVKNCGSEKIKRAFKKPNFFKFVYGEKIFGGTENKSSVQRNISIPFSGLEKNKKYFGVLIANVNLFPNRKGYLLPVRKTKVYYDEFRIISPRFQIPIILLICCVIIIGIFTVLFLIIKEYIFGHIRELENLNNPTVKSLNLLETETKIGSRGLTMLEKVYYQETKRERLANAPKSQSSLESTDETDSNISSSQSLEDHCQAVELQETQQSEINLDV